MNFADISVDLINRQVTRAGENLHLTPIEFRLLTALLANTGKVITQRQLLNQVWGRIMSSTAITCAFTWGIYARN